MMHERRVLQMSDFPDPFFFFFFFFFFAVFSPSWLDRVKPLCRLPNATDEDMAQAVGLPMGMIAGSPRQE